MQELCLSRAELAIRWFGHGMRNKPHTHVSRIEASLNSTNVQPPVATLPAMSRSEPAHSHSLTRHGDTVRMRHKQTPRLRRHRHRSRRQSFLKPRFSLGMMCSIPPRSMIPADTARRREPPQPPQTRWQCGWWLPEAETEFDLGTRCYHPFPSVLIHT